MQCAPPHPSRSSTCRAAALSAQIAKRLVGLLDHDNASVVSRAAHDLQALAQDHAGAPVVIVNAGAISPLVTVLSNGKTDEGRTEAAKTLHTLANSGPANQVRARMDLGMDLGMDLVMDLASGPGPLAWISR